MALDTVFFSNSGSDESGTGTQLNPFATPLKASQNVNPGGKVYGRGGTYTGIRGTDDSNDTFKSLPSGVGAAYGETYTTVMPFNGEPVEFIAHSSALIMIRTPNNFTKLRFQGLKLTGNAGSLSAQACFSGAAGAFAGSFLDILNCDISGFRNVTIQTASSTDGRLLDSTVHDILAHTNDGGGYPIYINQNAHRWEVGRNTLYNTAGYAIHHYSGSGEANECRYHDNLIYNVCTTSGSAAVLVANGSGHWVWNNIVIPARNHGFEAEFAQVGGTDARNSIWAHNIAYGCPGYGFSFTQNGSNNLLINNIAVGNTLGAIRDLEGTTRTTNLVSVSPASIFVDPAGRNFHLRPTATGAIGQGTLHPSFLLDRDGRTRIAPVDIGPYATVSASILGHLAALGRRKTVSLALSGFR